MAGAIDKKINDVIGELKGAPATHIGARAAILTDIALSREFAATFLNAVCEKFGSYSVAQICENLAEQRAICYGARAIKGDVKKFSFPPVGDVAGTVNGALGLSEANTSYMGIKATDIAETYTVNLSTTAGTQTQGSNTFSVYVGDYYLVRSRVSGELIDIADDVTPYTTPDGDTVFGNVVAWATPGGGDVSGELEANTWNYNWAKANIASITTQSSGLFNELTVLRLDDHLTQGSNTSYTPLGPGFAQKFYLKRHADYVNTFTITGQTTVGTVDITGISETDIAKVKYGDVVSGTGIPADGVSIAAVQTADSKIRLNETGIASITGAITLTVNSVPFGFQAHDIFCQIEIVAEGLVTNDAWLPTGNTTKDGSQYTHANEAADDTLIANTKNFVGLLGFFDPNPHLQDPVLALTDLTKGASASYTSDGKEYGTSYPDKDKNPFKPSIQGTNKAPETKTVDGVVSIVGTQPTNLSDKDIWTGRFVRFDFERATKDGDPAPEFRYVIDNAEKFYYELPATSGYNCGTVSIPAFGTVPADTEFPATIIKTGLADCVSAATTTSITLPAADGILTVSAAFDGGSIPPDGDTSDLDPDNSGTEEYPVGSGTYVWEDSPSGTNGQVVTSAAYYTIEGNYVVKNEKQYTYTVPSGTLTSSSVWSTVKSYRKTYLNCGYNFAQRLMYDKGGSGTTNANTNNKFIANTVTDLKGLKSFRDPVTTGTAAPGTTGITDGAFDSYLTNLGVTSRNQWETAHDALNTYLDGIRTTFSGQNRKGDDNNGGGGNGTPGADNLGATITYTDTSRTNWTANNAGIAAACAKRVVEIDKRIGVPIRSTTLATAGVPPKVIVSDIPSTGASGAMVPYGRSLYNACNLLLGQDVDLLGGIIKDIASLTDLVGMVETARNKYDIFSGRDKTY